MSKVENERLIIGSLILLCAFAAYYAAPVHQVIDSRGSSLLTHALIHHGTLSVPKSDAISSHDYRFSSIRGRERYYQAEAPLVLNAPFVLAFELAGLSPVDEGGGLNLANEARIFRFIAPFLAAVTVWAFWATASAFLPHWNAAVIAVIFGFATPMASTVSRPFWSHSWAVLLTAIALLLILEPRFERSRAAHLWAGSLAAWAYMCRPALSLSLLGLAVLVVLIRRRQLTSFALGAGIWLLLFVGFNFSVFGRPLPHYFRTGGRASAWTPIS